MASLWGAIKSLAIWQILVLVLVLFGSGGAVFYFYTDATQSETTELAENQQLIPIRYGDIVNQVSTNGNVAFPERETVTFGIKGVIGDLLVEESQSVSAGQVLARVDAPTLAALEGAVSQARVDLLQAEEALAELLEPESEITKALERATAEERIAGALFQLDQAQEALEEVLDPEIPTLLDLEAKKEQIAATELQIQQRKEERDELLNPDLPSDQVIKAQEELIADARIKLQEVIDSKEELLSRNLEPDYEMKVAESLQKKVDAEKELAELQESLDELEPSERELIEAYQTRLKAQIALDEATQTLEDFEDTHGSNLTTLRIEKADLEKKLASDRGTLRSLQEAYDSGTLGLASNIRRWEAYVANLETELQEVRQGIVSQVEELEANLAVAQADLIEAEELVSELTQGPDSLEREVLEARANAIQANRQVIDRDLAELERPEVDPLELSLIEARIVLAEATLNQAVEDLAELREEQQETPDSLELELNTKQLELAEATLAQHWEDYNQLLEDRKIQPDPLEVALREQQIALAEATLAQAEEDYAQLLEDQSSPPDATEVAVAEQKILSIENRLAISQADLESVAITAPISGYVTVLNVETGDSFESGTEILEILDPTIVEVDGIVDEIDVLLVQVGTAAEVNLDALPGLTIEGVVTEIAEESQNQQGVVSFPIRIRMEVPEGIEPRAGLSAVANIVLREERNVLLVPQQALYGSFTQPVVRVMTDFGVSEQPVELGSSDDFWVAVKAGLSEGDQIVLEGADVGASEFSFRNLRRATGGGFGGRGGGRPR